MTSETRSRRKRSARLTPSRAPSQSLQYPESGKKQPKTPGTVLKLRRRQTVPMRSLPPGTLFQVRSGVMLVTANPRQGRRVVTSILHAGDLFVASQAPPSMGVSLVAANPAEVMRYRPNDSPPPCARFTEHPYSDDALIRQAARLNAHLCLIGSLAGPERVASCLLEFASRAGKKAGSGVTFELPLTRADMADYLALNADTLSRIMSRFRTEGALRVPAAIGCSHPI